jgi:hypothetical protein
MPTPPARDIIAREWFDRPIMIACIVSFWFLTFYILDASRMALFMIKKLASPSHWPSKHLRDLADQRGMAPDFLNGFADVKFVANHTRESSQIVLYPFIILLIMLAARSQFFERWSWPLSYKIMSILIILFLALCSFCVRSAARKVKDEAVRQLKSIRLKEKDTHVIAQITQTIEEIENEKEGAYAPWFLDRAASAFLIPSAGALVINLLEILFSAG